MTKCRHCGYENDINNVICLNCGYSLRVTIIKHKNMGISLLSSFFLPGISYFYIEHYYRGILFFSLIIGVIFSLAFYTAIFGLHVIIETIYLYLVFSVLICLYLLQIYDVIKRTKMINEGIIRFNV